MRKLFTLNISLLLCLMAFPSFIYGQNDKDVDFVFRFPEGPSEDVWVKNDTAYINDGSYIRILDATDPANPTEISNLLLSSQIFSLLGIDNYIIALEAAGLTIIDVSDPTSPIETGFFEIRGSWRENLFAEGDTVYVARHDKILFIDTSDKYNPIQIGSISNLRNATSITKEGNILYVLDNGDWYGLNRTNAGMKIYDLTNYSSPVFLGSVSINYPHGLGDVVVKNDYAYVSCYDQGIKIVDVSVPGNPTISQTYLNLNGIWVESVTFVGDTLFVANNSVLEALDATDPVNLNEIGMMGARGVREVKILGNKAYLAEGINGLGIVDISNLTSMSYLGDYVVSDTPREVAVDGTNLYVVQGSEGFRIYDITDPANPTLTGEYDAFDHLESLFINDPYAYVGGGDSLLVLNISNKSAPAKEGAYYTTGKSPVDIFVQSDTVFVINRGIWNQTTWLYEGGTMDIIDVSNKTNPTLIGQYVDPSLEGTSVHKIGNYVYATFTTGGNGVIEPYGELVIIDISDPVNPVKETSIVKPNHVSGFTSVGNYGYLSSDVLLVLDISDVANPLIIGNYEGGSFNSVISGNYAYLAAYEGLRVLDLTFPTYPIDVGYYKTDGNPEDVAFDGGNAFLTGWSNGLTILTPDPQIPVYPTVWNFDLVVNDGTGTQDLNLGVQPNATESVDSNLGEVILPPVPVSGVFDSRFTGQYLGDGLTRELRTSLSDEQEWIIDFQRTNSADDVTIDWPVLDSIEGFFRIKDMDDGLLGIDYDMKPITGITITNDAITQVKIIYERYSMFDWSKNYPSGWNLVSVSADEQDKSIYGAFPNGHDAYKFDGEYVNISLLHPGIGYWIRMDSTINSIDRSRVIDDLVLPLDLGWNMMGTISSPLPISAIVENPASSILSIYRYTGDYQSVVDSLYPGEGYWVNLSQASTITLNTANMTKVASSPSLTPAIKASLDFVINFGIDDQNRSVNLLLSEENTIEEFNKKFELPPLPPSNVFDVRVKGGDSNGNRKLVLNSMAKSSLTIDLSIPQDNKKLVITWNNAGIESGMFLLSDGLGGSIFNEIDMAETNELDLTGKKTSRLKLSFNGGAEVPTEYELLQNYPNPFNPSTNISYSLKDAGRVSLTVYNILGQEIRTLVNVTQKAGKYNILWDGKDNRGRKVAGGMYIYRIKSKDKSITRKMILLK